MRSFLKSRSQEDGFTLIELLVVVIIIAILAAVAVPVYIGIQNNAKKSSLQSDVATTKLNLAAVVTEDGSIASGTYTATGKSGDAVVEVSKSPADEIVEVVANTDGSFVVTASSSSLDYSISYTSTGAKSTTGGAVGTASAPYCTPLTSFAAAQSTVAKKPSLKYVDGTSMYKMNYYPQYFDSFATAQYTPAKQTAAQTFLNNWETAFTTAEASHHTATTNDTWADSFQNAFTTAEGGYRIYRVDTATDYVFFSVTNTTNPYMYVMVPKGGSSLTHYTMAAYSGGSSSLPFSNTNQSPLYIGLLSVNGGPSVKGYFSSVTFSGDTDAYNEFIEPSVANCK